MSVHYKFKNTKDYEAVKFDGVYISVADLKAIIVQQKKLGNSELQVENEETKELFTDDQSIPKNTHVIVSRLPFANSNKRIRGVASQQQSQQHHNNNHHNNNHHHHHNQHLLQQQTQPLQRNIMAHYKFHNDCQSSVLTYEQVKRLDSVMDQIVPIHGRGNSPTLYVKLKELIRLVKHKLQKEHSIEIRDVRLNGGAASYVLAPENSHYNDLDLIFGTDLSDASRFDVIRDVVLECLMDFIPGNRQQQHHSRAPKTEAGSTKSHEMSADAGSTTPNGCTTNDDLTELPRGNDSLSLEVESMKISSSASQPVDMTEGRTNDADSNARTTSDENNRVPQAPTSTDYQNTKDIKSECEANNNTKVPSIKNERQERFNNMVKAAVNSNAPINNVINNLQSNYYTIQQQQMPHNYCALKEAYVHKMVKVNDDDRWSLISLGVQQSEATGCLHQQHCQLNGHASVNQIIQPTNIYATNQSQSTVPGDLMESPSDMTIIDQAEGSNNQHQECGMISFSSSAEHGQQHQQHQEQQYFNQAHQQKQFPNSIELKFVDKMRRKFEFSVDSFQIILDHLIQFYDYAPSSTITIQRGPAYSSIPAPALGTATHSIGDGNNRTGCCHYQDGISRDCAMCAHEKSIHFKRSTAAVVKYQMTSDCLEPPATTKDLKRQTCSSSYYHLPLQSSGSPSNSIASSSGCSSSSSVVSSSSSSLSCDEDHDDLYCDGDGPPSSSASTSSLLSSTTVSMLSSSSSSSSAGTSSNHECESKSSKYQSTKATNAESTLNNLIEPSEVQRISNRSTNLEKIKLEPGLDCIVGDNYSNNNKDRRDSEECNIKPTKVATSCAVISENFYPTVIGRSEYGNFKEALYHLEKKLIATRSPEEIRGGGLLKYCNLLVKNYKPTNVYQIRTLERYMCSRFFIDFSDLNQQRAKLESYLTNHFSDDPRQKFDYLTILHNVVQRSTVCLMNHELRLTLNMIRELAFKLNEQQQYAQGLNQQQQNTVVSNVHQQQQQQQQQQHHHHHQQQQHNNKTQQQQSAQILPQEQRYYQQQQDPVVMQSGAYRVKLVNYTLAKPVKS